MKFLRALAIALGVLVSSLYGAEPAKSVSELKWLSGSWKLEAKGKLIEEHWMAPAGGSMIGMSRTIVDGNMLAFEFLRIEQRGDSLVYIAQPQGNPPTEFALVQASASELVFANPQHDFPQRIRYHLNNNGSVTARVEDESGKKGSDFPYLRAR